VTACAGCGAQLGDDARFCSDCGAAVTAAPVRHERKLATVLFADLVGSTAYAAARDPELVRDTLDSYYAAMTALVQENAGNVEKFIGDAVVAVFGAPLAREDHAERALDTALRMQQRFTELFGGELALRIGVNTGEFVVGRGGEREGYVTGDAVNVAARLEQAAPAGEVLVGERAVAAVGSAFEFGEPLVIEAKGKPEGVPARRLLRLVSATRPRDRFTATFVGREDELDALMSAWRSCTRQARPGLALVVGDPGVGKTSLVSQFRSRVAAEARIRTGRCLSFGRNATFGALAELLGEDASDAIARREILGLTLGLPVPSALDPRAAAEQLREAWTDLVTELARNQPLLLVVEDVHWASRPVIGILERVLTDAAGAVLILATTRPEHPPMPEGGIAINLQPLPAGEVAALLTRLVGDELPLLARDAICRVAEGNPFFLEEVLASLIDRGLLCRRDGGWEWRGGSDALDVPDTIQSLLAARIDLLPEVAKATLQAASVVGRVVEPAAIRALAGTNDTAELVARDFLRPQPGALSFKHALTREVAYAMLPKARRATLHAKYASWLCDSADAEPAPGLVAHHYWHAVDPTVADLAWRGQGDDLRRLQEAALRWLRRAADVATDRHDIDGALTFLEHATQLAPEDPTVWRAISRANALKYAGPAYWEAMQRAIELTADPETLAEMYGELAVESSLRGAMWPKRPSPELLQGWVERALSLAPPGTRAQAMAVLGQAWIADDPARVDEAVEVTERLGDVDLISYSFYARSSTHTEFGDYRAAYEWARRREQFVGTIRDPDHLATIYQVCVGAAIGVARFVEAEQYVQRAADIAERLSPHHAVHLMGSRVAVWEAIGDWAAVRETQPEIERVVAANAATPCSYNARLLLSCAVACAAGGLDDETRRLERQTLALDLEDYRMWFDPLRAQLALWRGDTAALHALLPDMNSWAMPLFVHCFGVVMQLETLLALGRHDEATKVAAERGQPGSYLEPFALRAMGIARDDGDLRARAHQLFGKLGLSEPDGGGGR
jgi:class 3 adenylate cyclase